MPASEAVHSYGTTLARSGNTIAEIVNINGIGLSADTIDVTHLNSADGYREFKQAMRDGGEVSIEGNFIPSDTDGQVGFKTDFDAGTIQDFVMTFPAAMAATWTFKGIVTGFATTVAENEKIGFSATLNVTGKPALGVTASNNASALVLSDTTLYPTFAAATYDYVGALTAATFTVTATFAAGTAVLTVNGGSAQTLTSTVASSAISAGAVGTVTELALTITEDGKMAKVYRIDVARTA